jgi:oligopeptidase B
VAGQITSEVHAISANHSSPIVLIPRSVGIMYDVDHRQSQFYIRTNHKAPNFKIVQISVDQLLKDHHLGSAKTLVDTSDTKLIEKMQIYETFMVLWVREDGLRQMEVHHFEKKETTRLSFHHSTIPSSFVYSLVPGTVSDMVTWVIDLLI